MEDPSVRREHEGGGLQVLVAFPKAGIAADGALDHVHIQAIGNGEAETEQLHEGSGIGLVIRRQSDHSNPQRLELGQVLLEVSQLLTAMASPVSPIKNQDPDAEAQCVGQRHWAAGHRVDREWREQVADPQRFHRAYPV